MYHISKIKANKALPINTLGRVIKNQKKAPNKENAIAPPPFLEGAFSRSR
jgi:hypothetical protein